MKLSVWILGKAKLDLAFILLPGILGIMLSFIMKENSIPYIIYAFIAMIVIDSGHVYITAWRTIFRKDERTSNKTYWLTPLATFVLVFLWLKLQIPLFWSFIVYFTLYHHMRQFYGIIRWYQKLNGRWCMTSNWFMWALILFPCVLFHFRDIKLVYYTNNDLLYSSQPEMLHIGLYIYAGIVFSWLVFEATLLKHKIYELNRFLSVLVPGMLYGFCMLVGTNHIACIFPLLLAHGIPYFAIIDVSLKKIEPKKFKSALKILGLLLLTGTVFALAETAIEYYYLTTVNNDYTFLPASIAQCIVTAIFITPLMCHYIWDAYIWTGRHRQAKLVYASN